jgi:hypothetical protein
MASEGVLGAAAAAYDDDAILDDNDDHHVAHTAAQSKLRALHRRLTTTSETPSPV